MLRNVALLVLAAAPMAAADKPAPLSHGQTARVSAFICPLWFLANWSYNASLSMTSVTSSTIIATTSSLFTFGFGVSHMTCICSERIVRSHRSGRRVRDACSTRARTHNQHEVRPPGLEPGTFWTTARRSPN